MRVKACQFKLGQINELPKQIYKYVKMWNNCHFHTGNKLQNFCSNKQCSLPLCPKCIHVHLSEPAPHCLISLEDMIAVTKECVQTCIVGLQQQQKSLNNQLSPSQVHKDFVELIQKYRKQNIEQINQYYRTLQQQIFIDIQSIYNQFLYTIKVPIEERITVFNKYLRDLGNQKTVISTLITIKCNDEIGAVEKLFCVAKEKKEMFKLALPLIQLGSGGRLQLRPKSTRVVEKAYENNSYLISKFPASGRLSRIAQLEDQLLLMRSRMVS